MKKFKLWSEVSVEVKSKLLDQLEMRDWDDLDTKERNQILKHLVNRGWFKEPEDIVHAINKLNDTYLRKNYGSSTFNHGGPHYSYGSLQKCCSEVAYEDLGNILRDGSSDVVLELLSIYASRLIDNRLLEDEPGKDEIEEAYKRFDYFANAINRIFEHYSINKILTRVSFCPRQEELVKEQLIEPAIQILSDKKWLPVQQDLHDGLAELRKNTPQSYSNAVTSFVSALQAYLQLKVRGETGKGDIDRLIKEGVGNKTLPDNELSKKLMSGIKSVVMEQRQKTSNAHPKKEYSNEQSARLVLNMVLLFIQATAK